MQTLRDIRGRPQLSVIFEVQGELTGEIRVLLDLLEARALVPSGAERARIQTCTDSDLLR